MSSCHADNIVYRLFYNVPGQFYEKIWLFRATFYGLRKIIISFTCHNKHMIYGSRVLIFRYHESRKIKICNHVFRETPLLPLLTCHLLTAGLFTKFSFVYIKDLIYSLPWIYYGHIHPRVTFSSPLWHLPQALMRSWRHTRIKWRRHLSTAWLDAWRIHAWEPFRNWGRIWCEILLSSWRGPPLRTH